MCDCKSVCNIERSNKTEVVNCKTLSVSGRRDRIEANGVDIPTQLIVITHELHNIIVKNVFLHYYVHKYKCNVFTTVSIN